MKSTEITLFHWLRLISFTLWGAIFFFSFEAAAGDLATYGRECRETIGVPVPSFDCDDPRASLFNQGAVSDGGCERPHGSSGFSSCRAGSKLLRYDDIFTDNSGRRQVVSTVIFCRGTPGTQGGRGSYDDIAVIQINKTKNASCWFSKQTNPNGRVPSPNADPVDPNALGFWGNTQPNMNCRGCHDNGLLIRTPAVARVENVPGKGYQRIDRQGAYQPGTGNALPNFAEAMSKQGAMCSIGNVPWTDGRERFPELKINNEAFRTWNATRPEKVRAPQSRTPEINAGYCTSCHFVGAGFSCKTMFPDSIRKQANLMRRPDTFPRNVWMPPTEELSKHNIDSKQRYDEMFAEPIAALTACCDNPNLETVVGGRTVKVCQDRFDRNTTQQTLSERGACALVTVEQGKARPRPTHTTP